MHLLCEVEMERDGAWASAPGCIVRAGRMGRGHPSAGRTKMMQKMMQKVMRWHPLEMRRPWCIPD